MRQHRQAMPEHVEELTWLFASYGGSSRGVPQAGVSDA